MAKPLRDLREQVGLSFARIGQTGNYSGTAMSAVVASGGTVPPPWLKVEAFLTGCGVTDADEVRRWRDEYDLTVAGMTSGAGAPSELLLLPAQVHTWSQLAAGLRSVRTAARLSYQQIQAASRGTLAKSTINGLLTGRIRPTESTVRRFLLVCQQQVAVDVDGWLAAVRRLNDADGQGNVRPASPTPSPTPPVVVSAHVGDAAAVPVNPSVAQTAATHASSGSTSTAEHRVRVLAQNGDLRRAYESADWQERRQLHTGATAIVWPLVFTQLTRRQERARGHVGCATSVRRMEPDCLDRLYDDVEAVVRHLFRHADTPILNLDGWVTAYMKPAVIDAHRRRRGARGAFQRPRLPVWLQHALQEDPWLMHLALAMLEWVGVDATAGADLWPVGAWAERRAAMLGEPVGSETAVVRDIETVLEAMRQRPWWYTRYVEDPLGRKRPPLAPGSRTEGGSFVQPDPLMLIQQYEVDDARLLDLAATAMDEIRRRLQRGEYAEIIVAEVLRQVFVDSTSACAEMDASPSAGITDLEVASRLITDPAHFDRIVSSVRDLFGEDDDGFGALVAA